MSVRTDPRFIAVIERMLDLKRLLRTRHAAQPLPPSRADRRRRDGRSLRGRRYAPEAARCAQVASLNHPNIVTIHHGHGRDGHASEGRIVGTAAYMAPETAEGTRRSPLRHLLAGESPVRDGRGRAHEILNPSRERRLSHSQA